MRLLLALLVLFVATVSFSVWSNHLLNKTTADLLKDVEKIAVELENNRWDAAYRQTVGLERDWKKKAGWWPTVLDHQEMDNIDFAMARFKEYVATRDSALSRGQLSELKVMIKHIPEKEALSLKNIF